MRSSGGSPVKSGKLGADSMVLSFVRYEACRGKLGKGTVHGHINQLYL